MMTFSSCPALVFICHTELSVMLSDEEPGQQAYATVLQQIGEPEGHNNQLLTAAGYSMHWAS